MSPDEFRKAGHEIIELIAAYRENIAEYPVRSRSKIGDVMNKLPAEAPTSPESPDTILRDVEEIVIPELTHWQHPSFSRLLSGEC